MSSFSVVPPQEGKARLVSKEDLRSGLYSLTLELENPFLADPGQFVLIRDQRWRTDPLLSRPFAVAWREGKRMGILLQVKGKGTAALASLADGVSLTIRGPQGHGFPEPEGKRLVLVAGAMGIAPLLFAWERYSRRCSVKLYLGVSCSLWSGLVDWLLARGVNCHVACDDGTIGEKGTVVDLIRRELEVDDEVWTCGPSRMMAAIAALRRERCFVSLEARMACGYGGCLGCVVPTRSGRLRACVDGPVFKGEEVLWNDGLP
ncbi:MAG: dihydroorotate dehydrogenase electron transfer subunit [Synergistaceae bacterium]|jgi:dihydroorotate dehydrogenase electron transfer subunit|nr:dihydroorotate dehydrogenase electron transfer subunit [Synergistaceae bacterium]